jgi:hypothetical protein
VALPLAARWLLPRAGIGLRLVIVLPLAALLLTPAYIQPGADTLAPALVVALFQFMGEGAAGAQHALRPLGLLSAAALLLGVIAWLLLALRERRRRRLAEENPSG